MKRIFIALMGGAVLLLGAVLLVLPSPGLLVVAERPDGALRNDEAAKALLCWSATEREAWLDAVINDPLLPGRILPSNYLGQQGRWPPAKAASRQLRTFKPE